MKVKEARVYFLVAILVLSVVVSAALISAWIPFVKDNWEDYNQAIEKLQEEKVVLQEELDNLLKEKKENKGDDVYLGFWQNLVKNKRLKFGGVSYGEARAYFQDKIRDIEAEISRLEKERDVKYPGETKNEKIRKDQESRDELTGLKISDTDPQWWTDLKTEYSFLAQWESGEIQKSSLKIFILALFIILFFSIFAFVDFPPNFVLKIVASVIMGFIVSWMLTPDEILDSLIGLKALGVSLMIFFPILILTFFSFVIGFKMRNPFGIMAQKILWLVYGLFLVLRTGAILFSFLDFSKVSFFSRLGRVVSGFFKGLVGWTSPTVSQGDLTTMLIIHFVVGLVVIWIFVLKNSDFIEWAYKQRIESEATVQKEKIAGAKAAVDVWNEGLRGGRK
jgi:hypothetical protein